MSLCIQTGPVHHLALTVTQVRRSADFYSSLLGFQPIMEYGPRILLFNGSMVLAITPPPDASQSLKDDQFNENRVGLDHLSFGVKSKADLEEAFQILNQHDVPHGEIRDLGGDLRIFVLAFRDPDNIQIELTAPYE
jgi:catechol 2,3-dioxygenase-like lactoylglutathione lyase family enzyme